LNEFDDFITQQQIDEYEEVRFMAELDAEYAASLND
jgi:hypothetical protein